MSVVRIGDFPLPVSPQSIAWTYSFNTREIDTLAGRVVQFLSCKVDSLTVSGKLRSLVELERFERFVMTAMSSRDTIPFSYPSRDWYAKVRIESFPSMSYSNDSIAPSFSLGMVVDEGLAQLARISQEQELERIVDGIQWERSAYNDYTMMPESNQAAMEQSLISEFGRYTVSQWGAMPDAANSGAGSSPSSSGMSNAETIRKSVIIGDTQTRFDERSGIVVDVGTDVPFSGNKDIIPGVF